MSVPFEPELVGHLDLSAASAVVPHGRELVVVADDGIALGRFDVAGRRLGTIELGIASLPDEPRARKRAKPDFEALALLDESTLLVLGSGSTVARSRGLRVDLARNAIGAVDLAPLHERLRTRFPELNLEGAAIHGDLFVLAQRANGALGDGGLVLLDRAIATESARAGRIDPGAIRDVVTPELGTIDGVPLAFTDLAVDSLGRLWFAAAAEDAASTYDDGPTAGSILGRFDESYRVEASYRVPRREKIEGLCFLAIDGIERGYLVADPDDPNRRATLARFVP